MTVFGVDTCRIWRYDNKYGLISTCKSFINSFNESVTIICYRLKPWKIQVPENIRRGPSKTIKETVASFL